MLNSRIIVDKQRNFWDYSGIKEKILQKQTPDNLNAEHTVDNWVFRDTY